MKFVHLIWPTIFTANCYYFWSSSSRPFSSLLSFCTIFVSSVDRYHEPSRAETRTDIVFASHHVLPTEIWYISAISRALLHAHDELIPEMAFSIVSVQNTWDVRTTWTWASFLSVISLPKFGERCLSNPMLSEIWTAWLAVPAADLVENAFLNLPTSSDACRTKRA